MSITSSPIEHKPAFGYACTSQGRGQVDYVSAGGSADVATGSGFTLQTRVNCGSVGKLVTASLVTRLWPDRGDRERLRIGALLPGIPGPHAGATVEGCLTHTTGLWDFRSLIPLFGERSMFAYGVSDALELSVLQTGLVPGFEQQYSNTNYLLLGLAVEREAGATLQELVSDWLGPDVGNFVNMPRAVVPARARGYEITDSGEILEFGSFVDGRGSTNFWADARELATLMELVTEGYTRRPDYGGLKLGDTTFYTSGQDGGFQAGAVVDIDAERCHVAITNNPTLSPPEILETHVGVTIGSAPTSPAVERPACAPIAPAGEFMCGSLGVTMSVMTADYGSLVAHTGGRVLGRLKRTVPGSFSDGHLDIFGQDGGTFLNVNHAWGIPLERVAP